MPRGGSKPGERRGGRKKGEPNKRTAQFRATVLEKLREMDCDPIEKLAAIANDEKNPIDCRIRVLTHLSTFVYPQLTRAEMTGPNEGPIETKATIRVVYVNQPKQINASDD